MDQLTYGILTEVFGRLEAELIESLLEAQGIDTELVQESVGHSIYPVAVDGLGRVQIFVPKTQLEEAHGWLKKYHDGIQED
jgi:hypothetical protein